MSDSYLNRATPGVYINEINAFGSSIVGVATAVPVFIGYTQFAGDPTTGASLYNTAVAIGSLSDFVTYFGGPAERRYAIAPAGQATPSFTAAYMPTGATAPQLEGFVFAPAATEPGFALYQQMQLFFANGGGNCYVVSVGSYWSGQLPTALPDPSGWLPGAISAGDLTGGLTAASHAAGPTMMVVPEACQLSLADYGTVACAMIGQASALQDRVAILDVPGCLGATSFEALQTCQSDLWTAIAPQVAGVSYGAAYAPALAASVTSVSDLTYTNLQSADNHLLNNILTVQAAMTYSGPQLATVQAAIATAYPITSGAGVGANDAQFSGDGSAYPTQAAGQTLAQWQVALTAMLTNALPIFKQIEQLAADSMNILAPSGAIAGVWAQSDQSIGVWNAPANIALASVDGLLVNLNDTQQGGFNAPVNGEAINIVRAQPNRGNVVWGARTLDGNSLDYRYIPVRRTLIYIEQSIKLALQPYVFAANDATTWSTVNASVSSFLTGLWQAGGLQGSKASSAFSVTVGLGSTMTQQDILNGYMIVSVAVALVHPAEFIVLTFTQTMGS